MDAPIISVEVRHWCKRPDGVVAALVQFRGRDRAAAVAAWNRQTARREALEEAAGVAEDRDLSIMSSTAVDVEARKIANAIRELIDLPPQGVTPTT
jgi:hypothetical protein